jgi:hypothetical protein
MEPQTEIKRLEEIRASFRYGSHVVGMEMLIDYAIGLTNRIAALEEKLKWYKDETAPLDLKVNGWGEQMARQMRKIDGTSD